MKINYSIDETDYLTFQLYTASASPLVKKRRFISRLIPAIAYLLLAGTFFYRGHILMIIAFVALAFVWFFFYSLYDRNLYKNQYQKFIREHMKNKFGKKASLAFGDQFIVAKDEVLETTVQLNEVESITEIPTLYLIKLTSNQSFILPKDKSEAPRPLNEFFAELATNHSIPFYVKNEWLWK